jgi:hypothetical protein
MRRPYNHTRNSAFIPPIEPTGRAARLMDGRRVRGTLLRSRTSRFADSGIAAAFGLFVALFGGAALGFYWLMQPTVLKNHGMAAYSPPPMTVVSSVPWVPPDASSEVNAAFAYAPPRKVEESGVPAPKSEIKPNEARPAPQRQRRVRARPAPGWGYAAGRNYGFRPWF